MRHRSFGLFLLSLLFSLFLSSCHRKHLGDEKGIEQVTHDDRLVLSAFFEILIKHNEGGFTLFGKKPISYIAYLLPENSPIVNQENVFSIVLEEGWKAFERNRPIFKSDNFVLKRSLNPLDSKIVNIQLINKKEALKTLRKNLDIFMAKYGEGFDPENYLDNLENINTKEPKLMGILLGYGRKNAWAFDRIKEISMDQTLFDNSFSSLTEKSQQAVLVYGSSKTKSQPVKSNPTVTSGFTSLSEELNYITAHLTSFELEGAQFPLTEFCLPGFRCLENDLETLELKESYQETLHILTESYKNRSFLDVTFEQWRKS